MSESDTAPKGANSKKNFDPPRRNGYDWLPLEHLMAAEAWARNGFQYVPPDHPEVIGLAEFWGRTPGAVENKIYLYGLSLDQKRYDEWSAVASKRFELDLVRALYMRAHPESIIPARELPRSTQAVAR